MPRLLLGGEVLLVIDLFEENLFFLWLKVVLSEPKKFHL
jgi:hypothetical protein